MDSLLAALTYGVPATEREGAQIPLPTTGQELQEILTSKGWNFTSDASQFINSAFSVNWKGDTFFQHTSEGGEPHWDKLQLAATMKGRKDLYVICVEKPPLDYINIAILESKPIEK